MNPKLLIVIVILLIALYIIAGTSLVSWSPSLSAPGFQALSKPGRLNISDIERAPAANTACQVNTNRRELVLPAGEGCDFVIKKSTSGPLVRAFTLRLTQGSLEGDIGLTLVFDGKLMNVKRSLTQAQPQHFELYQAGGTLSIPACQVDTASAPCLLKITND